ncbi:MAG: UDP-N-acetylmuramoylalanyl-D-glutamyl-2,6-diaminopimelate--D-alanyl-D-alanine ligase [Roseibium album]|uniref:UDP-N-acetylmuramoyl-tripeptide--D-alanyl-D-alanine ligase n=1 Tax=Roseibium album TaxID=311410 RepID=A0A0M6ZBF1_9HYPH|nr:UDP-N-acetylmuramoylalanyl-D-glutamyl-2,6-diaminopimelate--D-alanyl-D-alanine ligase [Roseibium album]MBG6145034.1 UDP-N-acetylmuramoyl-tripeptide--D-alanyl-D-alanine ligase [Labrenzia sp. EL_142]MBG6203104.1 UDP-N-acetylmuramoyl-tripeptide--D-alanyl-D-alanine ligase [Labrenzia sp. EL_13]MCR9056921.1 UDP-N-acetylmuramoylalanyl-D-glutamyl-2,6-diaminopimelate--D-alanyl-D-alanine ligase [Paracoccaceae bacterium]CTQ59747.1 UDP-N-acetylmuramoyl-tripeptide--D-alanyl-D-alanine ligase [Roseibium alb
MSDPLWKLDSFVEAAGGSLKGDVGEEIMGVSIDSRSLEPGDAFIAIRGDRLDGHDYVAAALEAGAALAVVAESRLSDLPEDGRYLVVPDPLEAMRLLGIAARERSHAKIIAVTGSVGKTGTKEALRLTLEQSGKVHASVASFNNHWGVPLTLARMPADTEFGVFEIGMNHAGEITPLVRMVRPHVVIITTVQAVHLEFFESVEKIAQAKAEIFDGLEPGGIAILNKDNRQYDLLRFLAAAAGVSHVQTFGEDPGADSHTENVVGYAGGSSVDASIAGTEITYKIGAPGRHHIKNSLAVLTAVQDVGADLAKAGLALDAMRAPRGRGEVSHLKIDTGEITLIDESYNANPASMRAALAVLGETPVSRPGRRIAVLGDMRELGVDADRLHAGLLGPVTDAGIDGVYCAGPHMHTLWAQLPHELRSHYAEDAKGLEDAILRDARPGDVVMIKGSLGTRMGPLVEALKKEYPPADDTAAA